MAATPRIKNRWPFLRWPLIVSLLLAGCAQKGWIYTQVISDCPQFNSAQLRHIPHNAFSGIEVQFLKGEFGILCFLSVYSRQILSNHVVLMIEGTQTEYTATLMQGEQRMLLPPEATENMIRALLSGNAVVIYLEGFSTELCPENFLRKYKKFNLLPVLGELLLAHP